MNDQIDTRWGVARPRLIEAARKAGVDVGVMVKIAGFESGFDPDVRPIARDPARNTVRQFDGTMAISSAYGYGQFLNATWGDMIRRYGGEYGVENAAQMTNAQANAHAVRGDTRLQAAMLAELTRENVERGARLGGPNAAANVYALHNLGQADGTSFLNAFKENPQRRVDAILSPAVIRGNPALYGDGSRSVSAAYEVMGQHMDRYEQYAVEARQSALEQSQGELQQMPQRRADARAFVDDLLRQGEQGSDVRGLQQSMNQLGFRDAQGLALAEDSDYGHRTKEAVEAFQRANGLNVDGIAGPDTLTRIGERLPQRGTVTAAEITGVVTGMANHNHPDHPLYRQAYDGLKQLDSQKMSFRSEQEYRNAAGTLAFEARVSGLQRIDHVIANRDGTGLFVVQGAMNDPAHHRIYVDKAQAAHQSIERSTQQIEQERQRQPDLTQQERHPSRMMMT
jgi:hypothetical protein